MRENRTHGSMGGERKPESVGHAARQQAPLACPTTLGWFRLEFAGSDARGQIVRLLEQPDGGELSLGDVVLCGFGLHFG